MEILETKKIRLVNETWSNGRPLPNFSQFLGPDDFRQEDGFIDFYERYYFAQLSYPRYSLQREHYKIEDVYKHKDYKFYFFVKSSNHIATILEKDNFQLSDELKKCLIECQNINVVFLTEHEPDDEMGYVKLKNFIKVNNLNENQFLLLNNNGKLDEYNKKFNGNIQHYKLNLISLTAGSIFYDLTPDFITDKIGKLFICHNKTPKFHRYALLALLIKNNVIDDVNWSLVPGSDYSIDEANHLLGGVLDSNTISHCIDEIKYLFSIKLKKSDFELNKNYFNERGEIFFDRREFKPVGPGAAASGGLLLPENTYSYEHSYINIVTESEYRDNTNVIHVSEKSLRPFAFFNLPIILATHGHVEYMKKRYGFDFYDDIINHDYDKEADIKKRLFKLLEEIKRLRENKNQIVDFYKSNQDRIRANNKIFLKLTNDESDFNFFKSLMS